MNGNDKYRVLVVDDEASVLTTYHLILQQQGYAVTACRTSREAIAAVDSQHFDAILCDYSLEEQHTGFEVITAARKHDPDVPAALLTGYATLETVDEAQLKSIRVMFKPIEIQEFLATTSNMLRRTNEPDQKVNREKHDEPQGEPEGRRQGDSGRAGHRSPTRSVKG